MSRNDFMNVFRNSGVCTNWGAIARKAAKRRNSKAHGASRG
jgi:hypothetical protein